MHQAHLPSREVDALGASAIVIAGRLLDEGSELFHRVTHLLHLTQPVTLGIGVAKVEERHAT